MRRKKLPAGVYDTSIIFLYGTRKELNAYFRRTRIDKEDRIGHGTCGAHNVFVPDNPKHYTEHTICVVSDATKDMRERRRTLVHEVVHCAVSIFDRKGVRYSEGNDEQLCYFTEWLYAECEVIL